MAVFDDNHAVSPEDFPTTDQAKALGLLLEEVAFSGYRFITPTPATHDAVLKNRFGATAQTLRDIFGWNVPVEAARVPARIFALMQAAGILSCSAGMYQSTVRIASLDNLLFFHSGYPTTQENAVFFGPDTYRFVRFIRQCLKEMPSCLPVRRILDIGCGSGAGGIVTAHLLTTLCFVVADELEVVANDINPLALAFTAINADAARTAVKPILGDAFSAVAGEFDLIICNPPFLDDGQARAYRHGGAGLGRELSLRIAEDALSHLAPGGSLFLYTGVAIVEGKDDFIVALESRLSSGMYHWHYEEIDPDIFGEELARQPYQAVERIAAVGLVVTRRVCIVN